MPADGERRTAWVVASDEPYERFDPDDYDISPVRLELVYVDGLRPYMRHMAPGWYSDNGPDSPHRYNRASFASGDGSMRVYGDEAEARRACVARCREHLARLEAGVRRARACLRELEEAPMPSEPVPPKAVRLTLRGNPTAEQTLKASTHMLRLLRGIEREMRAKGAIPPGPPIRWTLTVKDDGEEADDGA